MRFKFSAPTRLLFVLAFVFMNMQSVLALGEGDAGWKPLWAPGMSDSAVGACLADFNFCKNGCGPYGTRVGPDSTFLGAKQDGDRHASCSWTMDIGRGCAPGANCGLQPPSTVSGACANGYSVGGFSWCYKSDTAAPSTSCSDLGKPAPGVGNPIMVTDGAKVESVTDYASGDGAFFISRHYRNFILEAHHDRFWSPGPLGLAQNVAPIRGAVGGWRFNFQMELHLQAINVHAAVNSVTLMLPHGVGYNFSYSGSGNTFNPLPGYPTQNRYKVEFVGALPNPVDFGVIEAATSQWKVTDVVESRVWTLQTFYFKGLPPDEWPYRIARPIQMSKGGYVWNFAYDTYGNLQSITDSYGRTFGIIWNNVDYPDFSSDLLTIKEISLPGGGKLRYTYDPPLKADGSSEMLVRRLTRAEQLDASGAVIDATTYHYEDKDSSNNPRYTDFLTGITDSRGVRYATFAYDNQGRAISSEHADGEEKWTVAYSQAPSGDLVRTVTNPLGKVAIYTFSHPANVNQTSIKGVEGQPSANCVGSTTAWTYDANGFVETETDEEGRVTAYVRDAKNRPQSITRGAGTPQAVTTAYTWDPVFNIATQIVEPGLTTNVSVDPANGRITQIQKVDTTTQTDPYSTNGQTRTTTYGYNADGRLVSVDGPLNGTGDKVWYAYVQSAGPNKGNLKSITNEMDKVTTVTAWNSRGQPTSITDPNGVVTTLAWEPARGLLTQMSVDTGGAPATTTIEYDPVGQVTKITLPNGAFESYTYDEARRLTRMINSAGEKIVYGRNANSDATSVSIRRAGTTVSSFLRTRAFDELGRLIKSIGADGTARPYQYGYDRSDNLVAVTDPRAGVFQYGFDPLNRLISETDEEGGGVNLTRDGTDNVTLYSDARNLSTSYIRNGFGEVIREISPDRGTLTYWRDARGLVTARRDARNIITRYTYDLAGRPTGKSYDSFPAFWQTFTWDYAQPYAIGRLSGVSGEAGVNWRVFDAKGRITTDYRTNSPAPALPVAYGYDGAGNITRIVYPSGRIVDYTRDAMGRVSGVWTQQNGAAAQQPIVTGVDWNPYGPIAQMSFGYGAVARFTTDTDYRITGIRVGPVRRRIR